MNPRVFGRQHLEADFALVGFALDHHRMLHDRLRGRRRLRHLRHWLALLLGLCGHLLPLRAGDLVLLERLLVRFLRLARGFLVNRGRVLDNGNAIGQQRG